MGHWPPKCFSMVAPSGQRPPRCFPTAANEWRSPLSAGRVGAYCIRPQTIRTRNSSVWLEGALICNCPCRGIGWGVCNTPLPLETPLGHWPPKCFSMVAPSGQRPPRCFPTAANEWRSPLSAGRVGAYCIRPQTIRTRNSSVWLEGALICNCPCRGIGWGVCNTPLPLTAPSGHWPLKCFPTAANEWKLPLSAVRVGAYCIRPQTIRTRNSSVWLEGALICNCSCRGIGWGVCNTPLLLGTPLGHPPIKWFPTRANEWRSPLSAGRVGAYCIRPQTIRTRNGGAWPQGAPKMFSNGSE